MCTHTGRPPRDRRLDPREGPIDLKAMDHLGGLVERGVLVKVHPEVGGVGDGDVREPPVRIVPDRPVCVSQIPIRNNQNKIYASFRCTGGMMELSDSIDIIINK